MRTYVSRSLGILAFTAVMVCLCGEVTAQEKKARKPIGRKYQYEEVDFENMIRRYFLKQAGHELEGIYSVSCVITKTTKVFLSQRQRTRVVGRKDNYARIAIMRDVPGSKRDFIEVSLSFRDAKKYPIVGNINAISEGNGFIYHHIEPDGKIIPFSMISESSELLEGEFSRLQRRKTITYRLSYLKLYPNANSLVVSE